MNINLYRNFDMISITPVIRSVLREHHDRMKEADIAMEIASLMRIKIFAILLFF